MGGGASRQNDESALWAVSTGRLLVDFESGRIYSTLVGGGRRRKQPVSVGHADRSGYLRITLGREGREYTLFAHRVVWIAANGLIPHEMFIDHINGVKDDNRLSNLRVVDCHTNMAASYAIGLRPRGENHPRAKLSDAEVAAIRREREEVGTTYAQLASTYNVSTAQIRRIVHRIHRAA